MRLIAGRYDISQIVEQVTWSGDAKEVARKLTFAVLPKVSLDEGAPVELREDNGKLLFSGLIFDVEKSGSSQTVSYTAYDRMWYVKQSEVNRVFDATPEAVVAQVCAELGVPLGAAAKTGHRVYMPCLGKSAYDCIMMAYTAAGRANGRKYIPLITDGAKVSVMEKGQPSGVVLDGTYNLTETSYKTSLDNMVNKVLITNKDGGLVRTVEDADSRAKYGTVQRVYKQEDGKDALTEAKALMVGIEQSGTVTAVNDNRAVSGSSIIVQEQQTGLFGRFYIESDTHTFSSSGAEEMQLTLAFDLLMDEREIDKGK